MAISAIAPRSGRNGLQQTPDQFMEQLVARYDMSRAVMTMRAAQ
jgi:hypothetical protein